ncbi:hypothetical protein G7Z17_g2835 [Cylindrodendrum hubeiense]|uniref:Helicase ATP-binding domain-containing protein n=1 Tax=Cylindrodendrum hubeiense TaxID=595255 RepID=A0A9P5HMC6_9HYPO|nr:hypothetical protein G7Z17_g2835 [Cylindrodendrum hubeiense]
MDVTPPQSVEPGSPARKKRKQDKPSEPGKVKAEDEDVPMGETSEPPHGFLPRSVKAEGKPDTTMRDAPQIGTPEDTPVPEPTTSSSSKGKSILTEQISLGESSHEVAPKSQGYQSDTGSDPLQPREEDQPSDEHESSSDSEDSTNDDEEDSEWDKSAPKAKSRSKKKLVAKKKHNIFKTAREFVAHLYEIEDAEEEKRIQQGEKSGARKAQKTSSSQSSTKQKPEASGEPLGQLDTMDTSIPDASVSAMPTIQATTHEIQLRLFRKSIPQNCDTRRKNSQLKDLTEAFRGFGYKKNPSWWMVKRELSRTAPYGGMLADTMGLGKTVVSLNTIVGNPPTRQIIQKFSKATLVVVPSRDIALQWQTEIMKHCELQGPVIIYSKTSEVAAGTFKYCWIVITTYSELVSQCMGKAKVKALEVECGDNTSSFERRKKTNSGVLFQVNWYRVILDEAHCIKSSYSASRTMEDEFLGRPILDLPAKQLHDVWVPLSKEEETIYEFVDNHYASLIKEAKAEKEKRDKEDKQNGTQQNGTQKNDGTTISITTLQWGRLSRLRQAVSHPFNLEKMLRGKVEKSFDPESLDPESLDRENIDRESIMKLNSRLGVQVHLPIIQQLRHGEHFADGLSRYSPGLQKLEAMDPRSFWRSFNIEVLLTLVENEHLVKDVNCSLCARQQPPLEPIRSASNDAAKDPRFKEAGRDSNGVQSFRKANENTFYVASCRENTGIRMPPSSKLTAAMAVIMTWLEEAPEDKIIVFTEFIMTSKALGRMLAMANLTFLTTMKCGGQSLNLTVANRVIILDPWWNKTQEQQAFGRVFRKNQTKTSYLVRILTESRIDQGLVELQESKSEVIDRALQDDGHIPVQLSEKEFEDLFSPKEQKKKPTKGRKIKAKARKAKS